MYKDLLDLRSNNWIPRRKEEKAKTIAEIRKDVEREERQQAQEAAAASQGNYRGNNYGGRGGRGGGDYRNNNRSSYGGSSNRTRSQRQMETDDDGFTTIGSVKQGRGAPTPPSNFNQKPQRILQSKPKQAPAKATSSHAPLDEDKLKRRIKTIRSEYMQDPSNRKELLLSVDEITGTKDYGIQLVSQNADCMIDCKEDERAAIYAMLEILVDEGKISSSDVKAGLIDTVEFIDSLVYDAPFAFDYLGRMLATMIRCNAIDVSWIGQEAEKTKVSSEANPEKIIRALIKAIGADKGIEAIKGAFRPHQTAMEKLLGAEKWASIKTEIS